MHFLRRLTLDLNTCCISVEEEVGEINIPSMASLRFNLDRRMLDRPHMPPLEALHPGTPAPRPAPNQAPSAVTAQLTTQPRAPRGGRIRCKPPSELLLPPGIGLRTCIAACLGARETLTALDNGIIVCLAWSVCSSCSIDCRKHRCHRAHLHLSCM